MLWMQWGAVAAGALVLLFFVSFTGYYFRNRQAAMQLRRRMQDQAARDRSLREAQGALSNEGDEPAGDRSA